MYGRPESAVFIASAWANSLYIPRRPELVVYVVLLAAGAIVGVVVVSYISR